VSDASHRLSRIHRGGFGNEHAVDAAALGQLLVAAQIARVLVEVFFGSELERIDEDAQDDAVGELLGAVHEAEMSLVQEAHRRDEPDLAAAGALSVGPSAHLGEAP